MTIDMLAEEDYPVWNGYLYQLQEEAPRPKPVYAIEPEAAIGRPSYFGSECHGLITRQEGEALCKEEGNFLIRESKTERGRYTLVMRILGAVKNFKLYWEDGLFFVGDKRFDSIYRLVEDGLITMYVEEKAHDYIQNMSNDRSVYSSLSKTKLLLTRQLPDGDRSVSARVDARASPRRAASVRVGHSNSPRYAHNGRNTEGAALPYPHCQNDPREYYDAPGPEQRAQRGPPNTTALEDQFIATRLITEDRRSTETPSSRVAYFNPGRIENSMVYNLRNDVAFQNELSCFDPHGGGAKKSLTPTSSDERKRPKAKKIATEQAIAQQQAYYQNDVAPFPRAVEMHPNEQLVRSQSSNIGAANFDSQGRRYLPPRTRVPAQLLNRPFNQSAPDRSPKHSPQRSPNVRRNKSDLTNPPAQYSMMSRLTQSNVAHVRQLGGGFQENSGATVIPNSQVAFHDRAGSAVEKIILDANDNQMVVSTVGQPRYHSPNLARRSPRQTGFDSSGNEVIPANTFHQLKMFHQRLEEDEDTRNEAQDEVTTLFDRGNTKTHYRLTRSHTTAGMSPIVRPRSGGKAPPRPAPRDIHYRQRSEPVELFQHHLAGKSSAGSGGSCDSSLSNVSEAYFKPQDSISHLSSEDWTGEERESSPSPHSTGRRSYSSENNSLPRALPQSVRYPESRNIVTVLQRNSSRIKNEQKHSLEQDVGSRSGYVPPPEVLSAAKPRRKSSDPIAHARSGSDSRGLSSETSSEDGTGGRRATSHKQLLQRRATTACASPGKGQVETNGHLFPAKLPSPKKTAQRSSSGPSPRKGKNSPDSTMSPRLQRAHHQRSLSSPRNDVHYYDKDHVFKSHTYRGLQWCEYCGNFMWGIIQQGMQCRDCGLNVHKQCSKLVPGDCQPALKHVKTVFGIDLTALVKLHGTERPIVLDKCIAEIEERGMNSEGIYRVSGFHDDVQQLKIAFDRYGTDADMSIYEDINIVAGGLKLYLRELPVPLIPYNLYSRFINAARLSFSDGKLEAIKTALDMMPPAHLQTLKHVIYHLGRVAEREANHMDAQNLGIVFGPTMLRALEKSASSQYNLNDAQYQKEIVQTMIENKRQLLGTAKKDTVIRETHNL